MRTLILTFTIVVFFTYPVLSSTICETIGNDSAALFDNGYIVGPQNLACGLNIHTEIKWVNVKGIDSIYVNTFQHRLYDCSRIYNQNNILIWNWDGENGSATWYMEKHSINVSGNDSIKLEFYQGYSDPFCNGYLQVVRMSCIPHELCDLDSSSLFANGYIVGPQNLACGENIHTESNWVDVRGIDSLVVNTFQHRLYDRSRIYDQNNQQIWNWDGENGSETWYLKQHRVDIYGNDSVKLEFYQGYSDPFCNGFLQVVKVVCTPSSTFSTTSPTYHTMNSSLFVPGIDALRINASEPCMVIVNDLFGHCILNKNIKSAGLYNLSLRNIANGVYIVSMRSPGVAVKSLKFSRIR